MLSRLRNDGTDDFYFTPAPLGQTRRRTTRPERGVTLRWDGMLWVPCRSLRERREAGYVALPMCWPPSLPKPGTFLLSGEHARFAYRVCEVERFSPPRGAKRYTCRLWCDRVDPQRIPKGATVLPFYWHPRVRKLRRARAA
jgi:hypothetical protein